MSAKIKLSIAITAGLVLAVILAAKTLIPPAKTGQPPCVDHILLEVHDLKSSVAFYRDIIGFRLISQSADFAVLRGANTGVFLWAKRWDWEPGPGKSGSGGSGMYPHLRVENVVRQLERIRNSGCRIIQEPRRYFWGVEAFFADPDGYIWALIS